ncbi:putative Phytol kinase 1 chloroplast precursor [Tripterygium wilfordii]|uniref:phytol kinase n=1 Tax=Tripterygium wilfordii TaxID=458696 RepID=A0A7J7CI12_TRIWF|nr:putative Phytol kinase 1 chloroplast precursor [Tripterygium wilfordii]
MDHLLSFRMIPTSPILCRRVSTSTAAPTTTTHFLLPHTRQPTFRLRILFPPRHAYCPHRYSVTAAAVGGIGVAAQDAAAAATVLAGAYGLVFTFDTLTQRNLIQQNLSRKLVHILSGLIFALSWPIFSTSTAARYFASLVPMVNCLRLLINGLSLGTVDEGLIKSVTREGKPEELLRGPLYYVVVLIVCALVFWRESPCGLISLAMMCGGDGNTSAFRKLIHLLLPNHFT